MSIRKDCADHLRHFHNTTTGGKLLAGHAHELVAAFFGYGSGAALRDDTEYTVDHLPDCDILVPDIAMVRKRSDEIEGLPVDLADPDDLTGSLCEFLVAEGHFTGEIWRTENLAEHVRDDYLPAKHWHAIMDDLSGAMAETNAPFDGPDFDEVSSAESDDGIVVTVTGVMEGDSDQDRAFSGDTIHFVTIVTLDRVAGRVAFSTPDVETGGSVDDSHYDFE